MDYKLISSATGPKARSGHAMVSLEQLLLFGGYAGTEVFGDLWSYDNEAKQWELGNVTSGEQPENRMRHTAVPHPINEDSFILFGGSVTDTDGQVRFFNDVWEFNARDWVWSELFCGNPNGGLPLPRHGHSFTVMDTQIILYGGYSEGVYLGDIWKLNIEGQDWTEITPLLSSFKSGDRGELVEAPPPAPRQGHSLIQITESKLFLFGGEGEETFFSDIWECDLENMRWVELTMLGVVPRGRYGHTMTVFEDRMILFGGFSNLYLNDLWEFDLRTLRWFQIKTNLDQIPPPRFQHTLVPLSDKMVLFGGFGDDGNLGDLWEVTWSGHVSPPKFSLPSGLCNHTAMLYITCETSDACIYYTTDESDPTPSNGDEYHKPILMNTLGKVIIKAVAVRGGLADSMVASLELEVIGKSVPRTQTPPPEPSKAPPPKPQSPLSSQSIPVTSSSLATGTAAQRRLKYVEQQLSQLCNACLEVGIFPAPPPSVTSVPMVASRICVICGNQVEAEGVVRKAKLELLQAQGKVGK